MLSYSWFVMASGSDIGMEIENATDQVYTISDPMYAEDNTGYYCVGTNNEGIAVSNISILIGNFSMFYLILFVHAGISLLNEVIKFYNDFKLFLYFMLAVNF